MRFTGNAQEPFNPASYMRMPIFTVSEGIAPARALHAALPPDMPALVKRAAG